MIYRTSIDKNNVQFEFSDEVLSDFVTFNGNCYLQGEFNLPDYPYPFQCCGDVAGKVICATKHEDDTDIVDLDIKLLPTHRGNIVQMLIDQGCSFSAFPRMVGECDETGKFIAQKIVSLGLTLIPSHKNETNSPKAFEIIDKEVSDIK